MSIVAERISRTFTEITGLTTYTSFPVLLYNKISIEYGRRRYIRFRGDGRVYVYRSDKDKAQTAEVTDHVTLTNPTFDRDWSDGTRVEFPIGALRPETPLRTYDFGSVKTRFLFIVCGRASTSASHRFYISDDGTTWTLLIDAAGFWRIFKLSFRYLRWCGYNSTHSTDTLFLTTVEAFDLDDYTFMNNTGLLTISGYEPRLWVILDGTRLVLYAYELDEVRVSHVYHEVSV